MGKVAASNKIAASNTRPKPLITAASAGHHRKVRQLLEKGGDLYVRDKEGRTALHRAVKNGHLKVVEVLMNKGGYQLLKTRDPCGWAAIHFAAHFNNKNNVLQLLLDRQADVMMKTHRGLTALQQAAWKGDCSTINCLLSHSLVPRCRFLLSASREFNRTALHYAAARGHLAATKLLMQYGADFNAKDSIGQTPLHRAAQENCIREVEALLLAGADCSIKDRNGQTPAEVAANGSKCKELLLGHEQHNPSLQRLCRLKIHTAMGEIKQKDVKKFPLPPPLKKFLLFKNVL